ncbi:MAG: aminoglycoside phosphotransferase family protein [Clostridia bacterium]|nr:aminoglycoside phosphotransferase family protein [Clostridia bacterium]
MLITDQFIHEITKQFLIPGTFVACEPIHTGHINNTYKLSYAIDGNDVFYLLQKINPQVFKNAEQLMANIVSVTSFVRNKIIANGGDSDRETLHVKPTAEGKNYFVDDEGLAWRLYNFIDNAFSPDSVESPELFFEAGYAFGNFQNLLCDFPAEKLYETIPMFHNTANRYKNLCASIEKDVCNRVALVQDEIAFAHARKDDTAVLVDMIADGKLPLRVTHNDTKLNNIMFDNETRKPICIVDLDTVMPGLSLYDFGDSIRFGSNTAAEDELDLSKVSCDLTLYEAFTRGYLTSAGDSLTATEVSLLPFASKLMSFECGMRFLTDYLDGDIYFSTKHEGHNLERCHTQFALVADMEKKFDQMLAITAKAYSEICGKTF